MSNEDFNKQTPLSIMQNQAFVLRQALPTIEKSLNDMTPLIHTIIEQYGDFAKEIIRVLPQTIKGVTGGLTPEQIIKQAGVQQMDATTPLETGGITQKQVLDALKNLIPNIPKAGASSTSGKTAIIKHIPKTIPSKVHGSGKITVKELYISKQAQAIIDARAKTFKESFTQQVGVKKDAMSIGKRNAIKSLNVIILEYDRITKVMRLMRLNPPVMGRGGSKSSRITWERRYAEYRRLLTIQQNKMALQKVKVARYKF